jgi:hypothetical protein
MLTNAHPAGARLGAKFWLSRFLVRLRSLEDYRRRMQAEDPLIEMADNHSFAYKFLLLQYQDARPAPRPLLPNHARLHNIGGSPVPETGSRG